MLVLVSIGFVILLFSTSAQACTLRRPIEDWAGEEIIGWADPETGLVIHPHSVSWIAPTPEMPLNFLIWPHKSMWDCEYRGFIQEQVEDEEHTLVTINVYVKEVPFMMFTMNEPAYFFYPPVYKGMMHYSFRCKILFNTESLYRILADGGKLPALFEIFGAEVGFWPHPEEPVPLITYVEFVGIGLITDGGDGIVLVFQIGIYNEDIGDYDWPMERVIVL